MATSVLLRSVAPDSFLEKPVATHFAKIRSKRYTLYQTSMTPAHCRRRPFPFPRASEAISMLTSNGGPANKISEQPIEKQSVPKPTFPNGFEELIMEVCDNTSIAEVKLKAGKFEMHLMRNVSAFSTSLPNTLPIVSPTIAPPIPSEPMDQSDAVAPPVSAKLSPIATSSNSPFVKSSNIDFKLAALEASGSTYTLIPSPTVGNFRRSRTVKGKEQPPSCKEGDVIKEGQTVCFLDQFGNEIPVRANVAGEVLKFLFNDGEAVGYGDPLIAVLPSFHAAAFAS